MVNLASKQLNTIAGLDNSLTKKEDVNWTAVSLSEVISKGKRLEANSYDIKAMHSYDVIKSSPFNKVMLFSEKFVKTAYNGARTKREYISAKDTNAKMFLGGSDILDIYPDSNKYLDSTNPIYESYHVEKNDVLITCSGTIGRMSLVNDTLSRCLVSQHVIKLRVSTFAGYIYAYLRTDFLQSIIKSKVYGSVVNELEPAHLSDIPVPDVPDALKQEIHELVLESYRLRDESNELIDEATDMLIGALELPTMEELEEQARSYHDEVNTFSVKLSDLNSRLEGSYHLPVVGVLESHLSKNATVKKLGDLSLVKKVILPGRFSRVYVDKDYGVKFIGGKDLFQLDSFTEKYLSRKAHQKKLNEELQIRENSLIFPSRGTLGKVMLATPQSYNWAISDNLMQVESYNSVVGYLYAFLNSDYGEVLIFRQKYGGVVNAIEPDQVKDILIPVLNDKLKFKIINDTVLKANQLRNEAFILEKKAVEKVNTEVLGL